MSTELYIKSHEANSPLINKIVQLFGHQVKIIYTNQTPPQLLPPNLRGTPALKFKNGQIVYGNDIIKQLEALTNSQNNVQQQMIQQQMIQQQMIQQQMIQQQMMQQQMMQQQMVPNISPPNVSPPNVQQRLMQHMMQPRQGVQYPEHQIPDKSPPPNSNFGCALASAYDSIGLGGKDQIEKTWNSGTAMNGFDNIEQATQKMVALRNLSNRGFAQQPVGGMPNMQPPMMQQNY